MNNKFSSSGLMLLLLSLGACFGDSSVSSFQEQLNHDLAAIDSYLASNNISAYKDASGIRFTMDSLGSGYSPRINDNVSISLSGKLLDGSVFEISSKKGVISNFQTGLQIGLLLLPNGSKATLYIPSVYAYGSQTQDKVPANSSLIYQIKLKGISVISSERTQWLADTTKINEYLTKAAITNVVRDTSGLRYTITQLGTGVAPSWFNKVDVSYTGYLITASGDKGDKFITGSNKPIAENDSRVVNYIRGFQIGLQKMPKGSKAIFYVPSVMGFGNKETKGGLIAVPANSNLIYEVELTDVFEP